MRNLQPLAPPDPLDPLVVDHPAGLLQQRRDAAIAIAAILRGQRDDVGGEPRFVVRALRDLALRRAMLAERRTGPSFGDSMTDSTCSIQARRRAGLRSFPAQPRQG